MKDEVAERNERLRGNERRGRQWRNDGKKAEDIFSMCVVWPVVVVASGRAAARWLTTPACVSLCACFWHVFGKNAREKRTESMWKRIK